MVHGTRGAVFNDYDSPAHVLGHREGKGHVPAHQAHLRKPESIPDPLKLRSLQEWVGTVVNESTPVLVSREQLNSGQLRPRRSVFWILPVIPTLREKLRT